MADRFTNPRPQFFNNAGVPLVGAKAGFFESGTDTRKPVFSDVNETIPAPADVNGDIELSADARMPNIFYSGTAKVVLTDVTGAIWTLDPVGVSGVGATFDTWNSVVEYAKEAIVQASDNEYYRSLQNNNLGNDPTISATFWEQIEFIRTWNTNVTYAAADIVKGSNGLLYTSLAGSNLGNDPVSTSGFWRSPLIVGAVQAIETLADLTIQDVSALPDDTAFEVQGYTAIGDGGGGKFRWDDTSTETETLGDNFQADSGGVGRFIRVYEGFPLAEMYGCLPSNADNTANFQAMYDSGIGRFNFLGGTYPHSSTVNVKTNVLFVGNGEETTIFDGALISSGPNFLITSSGSDLFNSGGYQDLQFLNGFANQVQVDTSGGGGGLGEGVTFENIRFQSSAANGLRIDGNSAPVNIGAIMGFGCVGDVLSLKENVSTVRVRLISGDANRSLCEIDAVSPGNSVEILGYKAERTGASDMDDVFRIINAVGGRVYIGRGTAVNQHASTPNAIIHVISGSSIILDVDPTGTPVGVGPTHDYPLGVDNDINGVDLTLANLRIGRYTTGRTFIEQNFSGSESAPIILNQTNSIAATPTANELRVNHSTDGAAASSAFAIYSGTIKNFNLSTGGTATITGNLVVNGTVFNLGSTIVSLLPGTGSPESNVTANQGSLWLRTDGGTGSTLYYKSGGSGNTLWRAVA